MNEGGRVKKVTYDVLVRNLVPDVTEDEIREVFDQFGEIQSVYLKEDIHTPNMKFGYVRYPTEEQANTALSDRATLIIRGNVLKVTRGRKDNKRDALTGPRGPPTVNPRGSPGQWNSPNQNKPDIVSFNQPVRSMSVGSDGMSDSKGKTVEMVMVCSVETPCMFWAQMKEDLSDINYLSDTLMSLCPSANPVQGKPTKYKVYATQFSEDGLWYRCRVDNYVGETQSEVLYIDYGNSELVNNGAIRELPARTGNTKAYAKKCILYGLTSAYSKEELGFQQGIDKLKKFVDQKVIPITVGKKMNDMTYVLLDIDGVDLNQIMLSEGFAVRRVPKSMREQSQSDSSGSYGRKEHDGRGSMSKGKEHSENSQGFNNYHNNSGRFSSQDNGSPAWLGPRGTDQAMRTGGKGNFKITEPSPRQRDNQKAMPVGSSMFDGPPPHYQQHHIQQEAPTIDMWNTATTTTPPVPVPMFPSMMKPSGPSPSAAPSDHAQIQSELQGSLREVMRLRNELATKQQEKSYAEQEMNVMVLEHAKLKGDLRALSQDCCTMKKQLQEMSLTQRLKTLLVNVTKIKELRKQFPTERHARDNIEWAIELVKNNKGQMSAENLEVSSKVKVAMDQYHTAQENIRTCADMTGLDALISARDATRKQLFLTLVEFEEAICHMPLREKQKQLMDSLQALEATHAGFLRPEITDALQLGDALEWYASWKNKKTSEFRERRALTNACHNSLNGSLNLLQQELALDVECSGESPINVANLDEPLKKYQSAVQNEIMATDIERSDESSFVTLVLKTLVGEIRSELKDIDMLVSLQSEYTQMTSKVGQWLEEKPDVSPLHKVRKTIKGLKSKLRHKLADKQDLEESDETDKDEISEIEQELSGLRSVLQAAFNEEDQLLAELSELNENHFPELTLQYPDVGIDNEIEYGGLVKANRSLEYYDASTLGNCDKSSIMKSSFCGNTVVLKELIIDDSVGVRKNEFLRRAMAYHNLQHPHVLPIQAIFFGSGKRNAYIQTPFHPVTAKSVVGKELLSIRSLYCVLRGVLEGLKCLHEAKLVHGGVHPNNVFVNNQGRGVLAEFDFTKSLQQRSEREFVTENGLRFVAPEVAVNKNISRASDIYNFGLLALWLLKPFDRIAIKSSGAPNLENIAIENPSIAALVHIVLNESSSARPTATELLLFPYFVNEPEDGSATPRGELTLQLRPKQPSPPACDRQYGGILKNASPSSTPPPLEALPQIATVADTVTTPDNEVADILTQSLDVIPPDVVNDASASEFDEAPPLEPITDDESSFNIMDIIPPTTLQDLTEVKIPGVSEEPACTESSSVGSLQATAEVTTASEDVGGSASVLGVPVINVQCPSPQPEDMPLPAESGDELDSDESIQAVTDDTAVIPSSN